MERVYQDAKDKYVTAVIFYAKPADKKIYEDEAMTVQAKAADIREAFFKGALMVAISDESVIRPNMITPDGSHVKLDDQIYTAATGTEEAPATDPRT